MRIITNFVISMETQLGSMPLNTDESSVKRAIMVVALVVMVAGMWFLRDLALMPIGKKYSKDDIKPRTIIGIFMVFGAVCVIANSSTLATFVENL